MKETLHNRITLFLMTRKGYEVLKVLAENYLDLVEAVISARDPNMQKDYYDEIKEFCEYNNILFYDFKTDYQIKTDFAFAISWRWIINLPSTQLIVFHDSLLPKYRGFNPLVTALINGDTEIGVTALLATNEYDRGEILGQISTIISYPIKIQDAINAIINNYQELALKIALLIRDDSPFNTVTQNDAQAHLQFMAG